jgi:uncharacterized membrane protein
MWLIIVFLALGVYIGRAELIPRRFDRLASQLTLGGLILILTLMGATIGSNSDVLANLGRLGGQALLIAGLAVAGSVLVTWALFGQRRGAESRADAVRPEGPAAPSS